MEISHPGLNLLQPKIEDKSVDSYQFKQLRHDKNGASLDAESVFKIRSDYINDTIDLSQSYLTVQCQVRTNAQAVNIVNTTLVANALNMFSRASLHINDSLVEQVQNPGDAFQMKALTSYSKTYLEGVKEMCWFYPDLSPDSVSGSGYEGIGTEFTAGAADKNNVVDAQAILAGRTAGYDKSFTERLSRAVSGGNTRSVVVCVPLRHLFGFCESQKFLRGTKVEIELHRESNLARVLQATNASAVTAAQRKLYISNLVWWVPRVSLSMSGAKEQEAMIATGKGVNQSFESWEVYNRRNVPLATQNYTWRVTTSHSRPTKVIAAIQLETQYTAIDGNAAAANPCVFKTESLGEVRLRLNEAVYPAERLQTNFALGTDDEYMRAYAEYRRMQGGDRVFDDMAEEGCLISYNDFRDRFALICFDLTHLPESLLHGSGSQNDIQLEIDRSANAAGNWVAVCAICWEREVSIKVLGDKRVEIVRK